jgi:hypothetical protein
MKLLQIKCIKDSLKLFIVFSYVPQNRVEAGSNISTVTLRVVRGDKMGVKKPRHS